MVKLVSVDEVLSKAQVSNPNEEAENIATSAARGMVIALESRLGTSFTKGSAKETFYIASGTPTLGGTLRLLTKNGFIRNVQVSTMESLDDTPTPLTPKKIDAEFGRVTISAFPERPVGYRFSYDYRFDPHYQPPVTPFYVVVEYEYGFEDYDELIPEWLREAALSYSVQLMAMDQLSDPKPDTNSALKMLDRHITTLLTGHVRHDPLSIRAFM